MVAFQAAYVPESILTLQTWSQQQLCGVTGRAWFPLSRTLSSNIDVAQHANKRHTKLFSRTAQNHSFSEPEQLDGKTVFIRMRVLAFVSFDPGVRTDMSMCCSRLIHHEAGDVDLPAWG